MFAFALATLIAAAGEPAYLAACPAAEGRVIAASTPVAPDTIHPTNRRVRFFVDLGSAGQLRRAAVTESSGDATFDAAALAALERFRFAPPTQGCISTSSVVSEEFNVPLISLVKPDSVRSGLPVIQSAAPAASICGTPFVRLTGLDVPDQRQAPETVSIDVGLDASARVTNVKLAHASGNAKTDAAGTSAARSAQYAFALPPGCRPQPTTYRLELTYH